MRILLVGGSKSGKSSLGESLACKMRTQSDHLYYIATMIPRDSEDDARILAHRYMRKDKNFSTIECTFDIETILSKCDNNGVFLLDSLTSLLANEMFMQNGEVNLDASSKIINGLDLVMKKINRIAIVSDGIHMGTETYDELTKAYMKGLAHITSHCARLCDVVIESTFSIPTIHKGANHVQAIM